MKSPVQPSTPFPRSYWVIPNRLLAGYYPGDMDQSTARVKLGRLLEHGVGYIVNLMEPDERDHGGQPFKPYWSLLNELATERRKSIDVDRVPMPDGGVPTIGVMDYAIGRIDAALEKGLCVYVHCWGGVGRTGMVIACFLLAHHVCDRESIFLRLEELRRDDAAAHRSSPENERQRQFVLAWSGQHSHQIDLSFRPKSYFWPVGIEVQLLTHIKGTARRAEVKHLIDAGRLEQVPALLAKAELSEEERSALGRIHPMFMGGEYLPNQEANEVEIARIEINSTTFDVTSVYARQDAAAIHYRVVDEYGGDTLTGQNTRESTEPLTLGQLENFFMDAWPLEHVLENNFPDDVGGMLGFFRARSEFYPDLDRLLRQRIVEWFTPKDEEEGPEEV